MSNNDDLFGGMFDINGDGKTDIVEEYLQFNYLEKAAKSQETQNYPHRSKRTDRVPHPKQHNIRDFILNCISAVFTCIGPRERTFSERMSTSALPAATQRRRNSWRNAHSVLPG